MADLRGHGASDKPETGYRLADYATDAIALLEALGAPQAILAGHSLGALTAIAAARRVPDRIAALLLEDPPLPLPNDPSQLDPFWQSFAEVLFGLAAIKHRPQEEVVAQIREWLPDLPLDKVQEYATSVIETADGVFAAITGGTFGGDDLLNPGPPLSIPTLLFQGAIPEQRGLQDTGVAALRAIFPALTVVTIPETGHSILEAAPVAYRQAVAAFFGD
jgi:pimeloyl-ACP methyl ester carboxylesterase